MTFARAADLYVAWPDPSTSDRRRIDRLKRNGNERREVDTPRGDDREQAPHAFLAAGGQSVLYDLMVAEAGGEGAAAAWGEDLLEKRRGSRACRRASAPGGRPRRFAGVPSVLDRDIDTAPVRSAA